MYMDTVWDVSYFFCPGSFIGLVNIHNWSFHLLQTNFQIWSPPPTFLFLKRPKGLLLETHSVFGLVNVDGVFLSNQLVDGRMTLLFLATFFERAICLCWRWQIRTLPSFRFPKRTNSLTVFMVIILSALVCLWGLFNDDHIKLFWEFTKPFPLLSMNSVSWLTTLPT